MSRLPPPDYQPPKEYMPKVVKNSIDEDDLVAHHCAGLRRAELRASLLTLMREHGILSVLNMLAVILSCAELCRATGDMIT